jgi:hypothetical protein
MALVPLPSTAIILAGEDYMAVAKKYGFAMGAVCCVFISLSFYFFALCDEAT